MAHNREEIDEAAATAAASITAQAESAAKETSLETTLAYGAEGECVTKLVDLLALLGHSTNTVIKGGPPVLDDSVLVDVRAAQTALEIKEPELSLPSDIPVGVKGELVGPTTWNALYSAAEQKLTSEGAQAAT